MDGERGHPGGSAAGCPWLLCFLALAEAEHKAELEAVLLEFEPDRQMSIRAQIDFKATAWLSALPLAEHLFDLSAEQWRDRLALQVGWQLKGLPAKCDGCGEPFTMDHTLCCLHGVKGPLRLFGPFAGLY